ncbi:MAG: hypothetical protein KA243_10750 [Candidatus Aminicenantes bacterium]|nr:hypothetical protein [Candidatus Aminicenantes bacterium]NLH76466.1 hypothetical protein [Acidobacteriota bacterium]
MEPTKPEYFRPALTAGAVAGLLSAIPFVSAANCVCCLWIVGAAAIAVKLLARTTPVALKAGDGAVVGALTGIVAAVVQTLLSIPLRSFNLDLAQRILDKAGELGGEMPAGLDGFFQGASATLTPGWLLLGLFFSAALFGAFGALGGIIGVSLFAKKAVPPQAPATPSAPPQGPPDAA